MNLAPLVFNGRFSGTAQPTGTQTVAFGLFDAIIRAPRQRPIIVFADPRFPGVAAWSGLPMTTLVEVPFQDWSRTRAQLWEQVVLPGLCRRHGGGLVHHPINTCPAWPRGIRTVVTLHDLNVYRHPEWHTRSFRWAYRFCSLPGLRKAERVVTISDYVREQALEFLGIPSHRVARIYNGVKSLASSDAPLFPVTSDGYVLCVGSLQPHKNIIRLIHAFQELRKEFPNLELWVVGRPQATFQTEEEQMTLLNSPEIRMLSYLSEQDLATAYRHARVFCYPSLEEGFGLPLLEAMQAGTLVVTSKTSCLPEIAGPAAELVDPYDEKAIAAGLRKSLTLPANELARRLEEARTWSSRFTWQQAAQEYLLLYEEMLNEAAREG